MLPKPDDQYDIYSKENGMLVTVGMYTENDVSLKK